MKSCQFQLYEIIHCTVVKKLDTVQALELVKLTPWEHIQRQKSNIPAHPCSTRTNKHTTPFSYYHEKKQNNAPRAIVILQQETPVCIMPKSIIRTVKTFITNENPVLQSDHIIGDKQVTSWAHHRFRFWKSSWHYHAIHGFQLCELFSKYCVSM